MSSGGIACSFCGRGPVVGQCFGYEDTCGRHYCARHQKGKHCQECGARKAEDDRKRFFQESAERLWLDLERTLYTPVEIIAGTVISFMFLCPLAVWLISGFDSALPIFLVLSILVVIYYLVRRRRRSAYTPTREQRWVHEIEREEPGFAAFYAEWSARKLSEEKKALRRYNLETGFLAAAAVLGLILSATRESDDERVRRIVDEKLD